MKIGLIARADNTGLGNQTKEFYDHMKPYRTMVIDISHLNGMKANNWYDRASMYIEGFPTVQNIDKFLKGLDLVFTAETPYNYYLFEAAKKLGIKTVLQYNYEFLDYLNQPHLPLPSLLAAPSTWHIDDLEVQSIPTEVKYLPVPVNRRKLPPRPRRQANVFFHIAGRPAYQDRNGTAIVLASLRYLRNPIKMIIYCQEPGVFNISGLDTGRSELELRDVNIRNYQDLYREGDVMVLPRKYGGLCLPLNEAQSSGIPVIMPHIPPNSQILPDVSLVKPAAVTNIYTRTSIEVFECRPADIAERIDYFHENPHVVEFLSAMADRYAEGISWEVMKDVYIEEFAALCAQDMKS